MKRFVVFLNFLGLALLLLFQNTAQSQSFSFRIAGATNTYIMGINDNLYVAGYYTTSQGTFGFVYGQNDTIKISYPGAVNTYFYDINNDGDVVGAYNSGSTSTNVGFKYNIYTHQATTITSWLSGYQQIIPYKINFYGDVVGSYHLSTNNWIFTMFSGLNTGSLHYNYKPTYGVGLNNFETVVGFYIDGGIYHGLIRSSTGSYTSFDYPSANRTKAYGINDSAVIVGEFNSTRGFIYRTAAPASFTEILLPGITEVHPYDINNFGYVAGYYKDNTGAMAGFILMDRFTSELKFKDYANTNTPLGVVADGAATIKLLVNRTYGNAAINSIKIELQDPNNSSNFLVGKMKADIGGHDSSIVTYNNPGSGNQWEFNYIAPPLFSNDNTTDFSRTVKAKITLHNNATNTNFVCEQVIKIIRPPVLLIHGLKSNGEAFQNCADYLIATGRYNSDILKSVDYKATNSVAFIENSYVLPTNLLLMKLHCRTIGYEVSKIDIVAHSMGAVLSRLYLQSPDYQDDIHKLIPVNSPMAGSQGANLLLEFPESIRNSVGITGNAFRDLCVNSDATRVMLNGPDLNKRIVPTHTVTSTASTFQPAFGNSILGAAIYLLFKLYYYGYLIEQAAPLIYNGPSDLIVAEPSQYCGCLANSHIDEEWHCGICSNPTAQDMIKILLEADITNTYFSQQGFNPPTLTWNGQKRPLSPAAKSVDSLQIQQPLAGTIISNGDNLNIQIAGSSGVQNIILYIRRAQDSVFLFDTATSSLSYNYTIPALCSGKVPIYVFGLDADNNILFDSTYVVVQPSASPDSIFISSPADSLLLSQGLPGSVTVSCEYSDGITRDITALPDVVYQLQTTNAIYLSDGILKGIQPGTDTLSVTFSGLSASIPVRIGRYYPKFDTINLYADICSGQTYFFYGENLASTGTFYHSLVNQYGNDSTTVLHLTVSEGAPAAAGIISGPVNVVPGQNAVTFSVDSIANATTYVWTLPEGVSGSSTTTSISLDFGNLSDSCLISVYGSNGCGEGTVSTLVIHFTTKATISGTITYDNSVSTPLNGITVYLKQNGSIVNQTLTDNTGHYLFENIDYGNYEISISTTKSWGGVNAVDALTIMQHFVGSTVLTGIRNRAADVNLSASINSVDALLALRRFVGLIPGFAAGDWLWDSDGIPLVIDSDKTINIKGLCFGDVNASYIPPSN